MGGVVPVRCLIDEQLPDSGAGTAFLAKHGEPSAGAAQRRPGAEAPQLDLPSQTPGEVTPPRRPLQAESPDRLRKGKRRRHPGALDPRVGLPDAGQVGQALDDVRGLDTSQPGG